jgi:hypothetical protein
MRKELGLFLLALLGTCGLNADTTEMIFYPKADFSSAVSHFYHQGDKPEKYGFLFDKGFDKKQILYAQPKAYALETLSDGKVKLVFDKTDHYSYVQQTARADFMVGEEKGVIKLLVSGGDCAGSGTCVTEENILTVVIPQGYNILNYKGLDHNLKELKTKEWKISSQSYTLFAPKVKGACIYIELEKTTLGKEKSIEKRELQIVKTPYLYTYQNSDLFVKGDVLVSSLGKPQLKKLAESIKQTDTINIRVFQDTFAPKRLAQYYPTAQLFSQARAESIKTELMKLGIDENRIEVNVIDDKAQKTRVEVSLIPAR